MNLTPLEIRILNAQHLAAGLAATSIVQGLILRGDEAQLGMTDRTLPAEIRKEALRDVREVNNTFILIASVQAIAGISA